MTKENNNFIVYGFVSFSNQIGEIDGVPVISPIDAVCKRFGLKRGDRSLATHILNLIWDTVNNGTVEDLDQLYFNDDYSINLQILGSAYFKSVGGFNDRKALKDWYEAKTNLIIRTLKLTRELDGYVQMILNYEDFAIEVDNFRAFLGNMASSFIISVYELRGIEFFLYHYMGGKTDPFNDKALFDGAKTVVNSLRHVNRISEAEQVEKELERIKEKIVPLSEKFIGPDYEPSSNLMEKLRISSEKFWYDYLSPDVWCNLHPESRINLIDAYSYDFLLRNNVFRDWTHVTFALCKVAEREVARVFFFPWKTIFAELSWTTPEECSNSKMKEYASRVKTLELLKKLGASKIGPTLGQLGFIGIYWNDSMMDELTNSFVLLRKK